MAATPIFTASFTATGQSAAFSVPVGRTATIVFQGGVGTAEIDGNADGTNWGTLVAGGSTQLYSYTLNGGAMVDTLDGSTPGVQFRFNCTAYTSGTLTVSVYI